MKTEREIWNAYKSYITAVRMGMTMGAPPEVITSMVSNVFLLANILGVDEKEVFEELGWDAANNGELLRGMRFTRKLIDLYVNEAGSQEADV